MRTHFAIIGELDEDFLCLYDDMFIGKHIPVLANDNSRAQALFGLPLLKRLEKVAEEIVKEWIVAKRAPLAFGHLSGDYADDGRTRFFHCDHDWAATAGVLGKSRRRKCE